MFLMEYWYVVIGILNFIKMSEQDFRLASVQSRLISFEKYVIFLRVKGENLSRTWIIILENKIDKAGTFCLECNSIQN